MNNFQLRTLTGAVLVAMISGSFFLLPIRLFSLLLAAATVLMVMEVAHMAARVTWLWLICPFYPIAPMLMLIALNSSPYRMLLMYLFLLVAVHDTGAYLIGSFWGTKKLAPTISPGKSWQGFVGGLATVGGTLMLLMPLHDLSVQGIFALSWIVTMCCVSGDLWESWLKRKAGVKDSGSLLPGHGGVLDRCDAVLFTSVFFYLFREPLALFFNV
jgi:CDP-diglyceride synthetase